ncbi:MAG: nucleotidyltransferase domain-containing protein [Moraxella sp.]|nr:nucleotidyltransferase domain-containing protein [Moraxella sp.]
MTTDIGISTQEQAIITSIIEQIIPQYAVYAFGSRVTHTARAYSDLDIVIMSDEPLSLWVLAQLKAAFDDSALTYPVDVSGWADLSDEFQVRIQADLRLLYTP